MNDKNIDIKNKSDEGLTFKVSRFKKKTKKPNPTSTTNIFIKNRNYHRTQRVCEGLECFQVRRDSKDDRR